MPPEHDEASTAKRRVVLIRHGETDWNRELRVMGRADIPLNAAGRAQCRSAAHVLEPFGITSIVSSPLVRALESARILASALGLTVSVDEQLEEVHFGSWQGQTYDQVIDDPTYRAFLVDPVGQRTPGGETIVDVQRRGVAAVQRNAGDEPGDGATLFVSHGDVIRATLCEFLGMPLREFRRIRIDNCGITAIAGSARHPEVKFVNLLADPGRAWEPLHWRRRD